MNIQTLTNLEPSDEGNDRQYIQELTGIPDLDSMLAPLLKAGGVILVGSETGEGRTAFASYIAARLVARRKSVRFISHKDRVLPITGRMLSSLVPWPNEKLQDGFRIEQLEPGLAVPLDCEASLEFQGAGLNSLARIQKDLDFHHSPEFCKDPHGVLDELVYSEPAPDCLIIDDLHFHSDALEGGGTLSSLATELMEWLLGYACEYHIPVVVTCLLKPNRMGVGTKNIGPSQIADFPKIFDYCDAFLGLTALVGKPGSGEAAEVGIDQYISVHTKGATKLIPVLREFAFQRFPPREEGVISDDLEERIRRLKAATKLGGCMKVRRSDLKAVAALRHRPSLNVFILALLVANWQKGEAYGTFFYPVEKVCTLLDLTPKEVRTALQKLEAAKMLERGAKTGRAYTRSVVGYSKMKGCSKDFFFLANNLRDPSRSGLLGNPVLLRTWITAISLAQHSPCPDTDAGRGQFPDDVSDLSRRIAAITGDDVSKVETAVGTLISEGRIRMVSIPEYRDFLEITNYEIYQSGEFYRGANGKQRATRLPAERAITPASEGQSDGDSGADEGQSEGN